MPIVSLPLAVTPSQASVLELLTNEFGPPKSAHVVAERVQDRLESRIILWWEDGTTCSISERGVINLETTGLPAAKLILAMKALV